MRSSYPCILQAGIYIRVFPSQLPWAAEHGYTQCLTMFSPGFGLCCAPGSCHTSSHSIPKRGQRAPVCERLSVCRSPWAGSTISPSPCSLQPGFLLHPARFTLLFPPPLPLPHGCQAVFAFLSPAVFPLPARAPPRSLPAPSSPRGSVLSQS